MTAIALGMGHDGHVTELAIDRLLYDPPGSEGLETLRAHVGSCLVCKRRLDSARQADSEVVLGPPAGLDFLGHLTELAIDRLALDEDDAELRFAHQHLQRCDRCKDNVASTAAFDAEVAIAPPAEAHPAETNKETANKETANKESRVVSLDRYRAARRWLAPVAAALAASLAFVVLSVGPERGYDDGVRLKGSTFGAAFYVHDGTDVRRVDTGDTVRAGERLGFRLRMPEPGHVMIVGVDSTGSVYTCHPQGSGGQSQPYEASTEPIRIDEAMRFDASPGHERLVVITCPEAFTIDDVRDELARAGRSLLASEPAPVLRPGCVQRETVLEKAAAEVPPTGGAR